MKWQDRRGFTLIELLVTILLLAIIALISFVSITSIINKNKKNECMAFYNNIKSATNEYISDNRLKIATLKTELGVSENSNNISFTADKLLEKNYLKNYDDNKKTDYFRQIIINATLNSDSTIGSINITSDNQDVFKDCDLPNATSASSNEPTNNTGTIYIATFYYQSNENLGETTINKTTASCTVTSGNTCSITIPTNVRTSVGTFNNSYVGLSTGVGNMNQSIDNNITTINLSSNITYYAIYRTGVTIYYPNSINTRTSITIYRNQWFTSNNNISKTIFSINPNGVNDDYIFNPAVSNYNLIGFAKNSRTNSVEYTNLATLKNSNALVAYAVIGRQINAIFYYYDGTPPTTASKSASQYIRCTETAAESFDSGITIPNVVTNSIGPNSSRYIGVSMAPSSITLTTPNTVRATYYAVYSGSLTASYTKEEYNVNAIGSTKSTCSNNFTIDNTLKSYNGTPCTITLPSITPVTGCQVLGWYDYDDSTIFIGNAGTNITIDKNVKYLATANAKLAENFAYHNQFNACTNAQCMIEYLDVNLLLAAKQFYYNKSVTEVNCSDISCMIDWLATP